MTGISATALGARTLLALPLRLIDIALDSFFISMIPFRHWLTGRNFRIRLWQLSLAGVVLSTGPLSVSAFIAYGLLKGTFLLTGAISSLFLYVSKVLILRQLGAMPLSLFLQGMLVGSALMTAH